MRTDPETLCFYNHLSEEENEEDINIGNIPFYSHSFKLQFPFKEGSGGQWEDSCFVSPHWLIYISTAPLSKWPLSTLAYENYRGHQSPFSFDRLACTHTSMHIHTK